MPEKAHRQISERECQIIKSGARNERVKTEIKRPKVKINLATEIESSSYQIRFTAAKLRPNGGQTAAKLPAVGGHFLWDRIFD